MRSTSRSEVSSGYILILCWSPTSDSFPHPYFQLSPHPKVVERQTLWSFPSSHWTTEASASLPGASSQAVPTKYLGQPVWRRMTAASGFLSASMQLIPNLKNNSRNPKIALPIKKNTQQIQQNDGKQSNLPKKND